MNKNTRNILIVSGVVVAAYLVYNQMKKAKAQKAIAAANASAGAAPAKESFGGNTGSNFWGSLFS